MNRFICIILALTILISPATIPAKASESQPFYAIMEAETRTVVDEFHGNETVNCGYLSKLMTLLLIAEDIETGKFCLTDTLTASPTVTGTKGAVVWLQSGDKMTVDELLKSVIVGNANDAVTVLAEESRRSIENFTAEMNRTAFDLGLRNTVFMSPYGYYDENEHTTANDIAMVCAELLRYNFIMPYFSMWREFVKNGETELVNENRLSRTWDRHVGFKAANSERSGYCIAEAGKSDNGGIYIAVVLGADSEDTSFGLAKKLINRGFSDFKVTVPGFMDELLRPLRVKNGRDSAVELECVGISSVVIPKGASEMRNVIVIPEYVSAPVRKGQSVGTVAFYNGDTLVYEANIVTKSGTEESDFGFVFKKLLLNLVNK